MKRVFKLGVMLTLSISAFTGCSADVTGLTGANLTGTNLSGYSVAADGSATALAADTQSSGAPGQKMKGGKGGHGGPGGKGGPQGGIGFAFGADLNLTDAQKTQLKAIMEANKPQQPVAAPDKTKMDTLKTAISDAFLADTFDATALKAKLDAAKPVQNDDRFTKEANVLLQSYNVLTAEQKATLEAKQAEMAAKVPAVRPTPDPANQAKMEADRLTKLATDLGLDDTQKTAMAALMVPPVHDEASEQTKRKANQDAINAALKSGTATVESIAAILKANAPTDMNSRQSDEIDKLAKIHDILNADQRKKFISNNKGFGFGPGGKGGPGGGHEDEPQGKGGHEGGKGGPRPNGKGMPSPSSPAA